MRDLILAFLTTAAAGFFAASGRTDDADWVPLFNGKDLAGWKIPNPPSGNFKSVVEKKNDAGQGVNRQLPHPIQPLGDAGMQLAFEQAVIV